MAMLEVGSILVNKHVQNKYWEQELIAIKKAYSTAKNGIRSINAQQKGQSATKAKQHKQIILRTL